MCMCVLDTCLVVSNSLQSMGYSLPVSSIHEILQGRMLEWVAISFSSQGIEFGSATLQADYLQSEPPGKPIILVISDNKHITLYISIKYAGGTEQLCCIIRNNNIVNQVYFNKNK